MRAECDSCLLQLSRDEVFLFFEAHGAKLVCTWKTRSKYLSRDISVAYFIFLGCLVCSLNVLGILFCHLHPLTPLLVYFSRLVCCLACLCTCARFAYQKTQDWLHSMLCNYRVLFTSSISACCVILALFLILISVSIFFLFLLFKGKKRTHRT